MLRDKHRFFRVHRRAPAANTRVYVCADHCYAYGSVGATRRRDYRALQRDVTGL